MFSKENPKINIVIAIVLSIFLPVIIGILLNSYYKTTFISIPLHSVLEASGGIIALVISMIFYMKYRQSSTLTHFNWATTALLTMGIIDIFHASVEPGKMFVWLHSIAVFFGGVLFMSVWLKETKVSKCLYNAIPLLFGLFPIIISLASILFSEYVPDMLNPDKSFTTVANALNLIGGIGFFIASIKLILIYLESKKIEDILFAGHSMLFGVAGLLFISSVVWDMQWWLWHILRLFAYAIAFYFLYTEYQKEIQEVDSMNHELKKYKEALEYKVQAQVEKNLQQNTYMIHQSRLAQLGEMISMIAHQWRQPLSSISVISANIRMSSILEEYDLGNKKEAKEYESFVETNLINIEELVETLSTTINDFRNFYKQSKEMETVTLDEVVQKSLKIIKVALVTEEIKIIEEYNSKENIELYDSEIMQVILNILTNTKENFKEKKIENPYVKITTHNGTVTISDNGGGIEEDILTQIFDPYFSTKTSKEGTGLGLYMSKTIIEKHHKGKLIVENTKEGVSFKIEL